MHRFPTFFCEFNNSPNRNGLEDGFDFAGDMVEGVSGIDSSFIDDLLARQQIPHITQLDGGADSLIGQMGGLPELLSGISSPDPEQIISGLNLQSTANTFMQQIEETLSFPQSLASFGGLNPANLSQSLSVPEFPAVSPINEAQLTEIFAPLGGIPDQISQLMGGSLPGEIGSVNGLVQQGISELGGQFPAEIPGLSQIEDSFSSGMDMINGIPDQISNITEGLSNQLPDLSSLSNNIPDFQNFTESLPGVNDILQGLPNISEMLQGIPGGDDILQGASAQLGQLLPSPDELLQGITSSMGALPGITSLGDSLQSIIPSAKDTIEGIQSTLGNSISNSIPEPLSGISNSISQNLPSTGDLFQSLTGTGNVGNPLDSTIQNIQTSAGNGIDSVLTGITGVFPGSDVLAQLGNPMDLLQSLPEMGGLLQNIPNPQDLISAPNIPDLASTIPGVNDLASGLNNITGPISGLIEGFPQLPSLGELPGKIPGLGSVPSEVENALQGGAQLLSENFPSPDSMLSGMIGLTSGMPGMGSFSNLDQGISNLPQGLMGQRMDLLSGSGLPGNLLSGGESGLNIPEMPMLPTISDVVGAAQDQIPSPSSIPGLPSAVNDQQLQTSAQGPNVDRLADQVWQQIQRKLTIERERSKGLS